LGLVFIAEGGQLFEPHYDPNKPDE